ncbi:MAG: hypothetical protein ACRDJC_01645 [Thermomicrobiales bacterium]
MAISKRELTQPIWANPIWPDPLPEPDDLRMVYGAEADELVVLFRNARHSAPVFDFIDTPDVSYSAVKIDMESGAVIGVLVYPLAAFAIERHPDWRPASAPNPLPAVASRIVTDVKHLYDQYGLVPDEPERE